MTQKQRRNYSKQCDSLFSKLVRARGVCEIKTDTDCLGPLQCCHGFSRRYRATRWDFRNAFAGCARHHQWWTAHPLEWDSWLVTTWGHALYSLMRNIAISTDHKVDPKEVLIRLQAEAKAA